MSEQFATGNPLPATLTPRVSNACRRFDAAWKSGRRPHIEDFLDDANEYERTSLLRLLVALDMEYRRRGGEDPVPEEYRARFPNLDVAWITHSVAWQKALDALRLHWAEVADTDGSQSHSLTDARKKLAEPEGQSPRILGRYRLEELLGSGGFGQVWRGFDPELQRPVAIKVPRPDRIESPEQTAAFMDEARKLARLEHPGIVPVYDVGREVKTCFIVSKLIRGSDLVRRLNQGRPSHAEAARMIAEIAEALHYAHLQGFVHRDIKPGNILLDEQGRPYVSDFGLSVTEEEQLSETSGRRGTLAYMSPEQARGESHRVDARADVYGLAVVFYELLTGRVPFRAAELCDFLDQIIHREPRPPRTIDDTIPKELERVCLKGLAKRVTERYTTAADMADDLRHWLRTVTEKGDRSAFAVPQPLPMPVPVRSAVSAPSVSPESMGRAVKIIPKGLRAFDLLDSDFFLALLPGPRDRTGLPESIRFWKTRIEEADSDKTFSVGVIYGPSGCGKSSFVKAGLLPRLSDKVVSVFVEATAGDTEARLLRNLSKRFPELAIGQGLRQGLVALRKGHAVPGGGKVLVVIDQFEQWLHVHAARADESELFASLRQADGERLQVLLLVRDDFWLAMSRLFNMLEIKPDWDRNIRLVDLFDPGHAKHVLHLFGVAHNRLPAMAGDLTSDQDAFLNQAVRDLSQDGMVIPVRLSLFADLMKGRDWTAASLVEVGGTQGVGIKFLEETFTARTALPEHRAFEQTARDVLRSLLPERGSDIKGRIRSLSELAEACKLAERSDKLHRLLEILDRDLHIITPTEPELRGTPGDSLAETAAPEGYYQLTHDYLVPPLRRWLTQQHQQTARGRAQLLLEEYTTSWCAKPDRRQLPSLREWLQMWLFTRRADQTEAQRNMLRAASRLHLIRAGVVAVMASAISGVQNLVQRAFHTSQDAIGEAGVSRSRGESLSRGEALFLAGDYEKALAEFDKVEFLNSVLSQGENPSILLYKAMCLHHIPGRSGEAREKLNQARTLILKRASAATEKRQDSLKLLLERAETVIGGK